LACFGFGFVVYGLLGPMVPQHPVLGDLSTSIPSYNTDRQPLACPSTLHVIQALPQHAQQQATHAMDACEALIVQLVEEDDEAFDERYVP
jgi:hypothetical protein